jgi:hypothetical protein
MSTILRPFGRTGLMVSPVTLGTMEFGSKLDEAEAGKLFAQALDSGITWSTQPTCTQVVEARRSWDG